MIGSSIAIANILLRVGPTVFRCSLSKLIARQHSQFPNLFPIFLLFCLVTIYLFLPHLEADLATQTGEVVLTSSEILPLLTSEFFGTLEREDLSRVLAAIPLTTGGLLSLLPPLTSAEILLQLTPEFFASLRGADLANVLANASRAVAKF